MFTRNIENIGGIIGYIWEVKNPKGKVVAEGTASNQETAERDSAAAWLKARQDDAKRQKRNAAARARNDAMRSIGMTKTRYGWE